MKHTTTMSVSRKGSPKGGKKGKLRHIHVETAENGVSISAHHEPGDKADRELIYEAPKPTLATSHEDAMSHIGALLADHFGAEKKGKAKDGTPEHEKGESKAKEAAEQVAGDDEEED